MCTRYLFVFFSYLSLVDIYFDVWQNEAVYNWHTWNLKFGFTKWYSGIKSSICNCDTLVSRVGWPTTALSSHWPMTITSFAFFTRPRCTKLWFFYIVFLSFSIGSSISRYLSIIRVFASNSSTRFDKTSFKWFHKK